MATWQPCYPPQFTLAPPEWLVSLLFWMKGYQIGVKLIFDNIEFLGFTKTDFQSRNFIILAQQEPINLLGQKLPADVHIFTDEESSPQNTIAQRQTP